MLEEEIDDLWNQFEELAIEGDDQGLVRFSKNIERTALTEEPDLQHGIEILRSLAEYFTSSKEYQKAIMVHTTVLRLLANCKMPDVFLIYEHMTAIVDTAVCLGDLMTAIAVQRQLVSTTRNFEGAQTTVLRSRLGYLHDLLDLLKKSSDPNNNPEQRELEFEMLAIEDDRRALERLDAAQPLIPQRADHDVAALKIEQTHFLMEVLYGTHRKPRPTNGASDPYEAYLGERAVPVAIEYGTAHVWVPRQRDVGVVDWLNKGYHAHKNYYRDTAFLLHGIEESKDQAEWLDSADRIVKDVLAGKGRDPETARPELLLYVHGFNTRFWEAVVRAAQLGIDLDIDGVTTAYSWPSTGYAGPRVYRQDEGQLHPTQTGHFVEMLTSLITRLSKDGRPPRSTLIAHSLGCRFLLAGLCEVATRLEAQNKMGPYFDTVVFAAPDVDIDQFAANVMRVAEISRRVIVYCSHKDHALKMGRRWIHSYDRAGTSAPQLAQLLNHPNVDIIDTSDVASIAPWALKRIDSYQHNDYVMFGMDAIRLQSWFNLSAAQCDQVFEQGTPSSDADSRWWRHKDLDRPHPQATRFKSVTVKNAVRDAAWKARRHGCPKEAARLMEDEGDSGLSQGNQERSEEWAAVRFELNKLIEQLLDKAT